MTDMPALDDPCAYVVLAGDEQQGPYQLDVLVGEVVAGRMHDVTPVWWPGLPEWTTMAQHPGIAAELQRRRAALGAPAAPAAPFAPPVGPPPIEDAPAPGQYQSTDGYGAGAPTLPVSGQDFSTAMFGAGRVEVEPALDPREVPEHAAPVSPVAETPQPAESVPADPWGGQVPPGQDVAVGTVGGVEPDVPPPTPFADPPPTPFATASPFGAAPAEPVASPSIDLTVPAEAAPAPTPAPAPAPADPVPAPAPVAAPAAGVDPVAARNYASLVDRSRMRVESRARVGSVDDQFVAAVTAAALGLGFGDGGRTDSAHAHDLRFHGPTGDLLVLSLGRVTAERPADLAATHLPATLTYRAAAVATTHDPGTGAHGEVVVGADQWTGQATSTVSLLLGLEDYLGADLGVDDAAVARDLSAAVAVLRDRAR